MHECMYGMCMYIYSCRYSEKQRLYKEQHRSLLTVKSSLYLSKRAITEVFDVCLYGICMYIYVR